MWADDSTALPEAAAAAAGVHSGSGPTRVDVDGVTTDLIVDALSHAYD